MVDPRLNSVHLEAPRRHLFRQAREELLQARGQLTLCAELKEGQEPADVFNTIIQKEEGQAPPGLKFWLVDQDFIYPLKTGLNTVGRSPDNDVVVPDAYVSRRHCAILVHANTTCEVHDIASKNGTFINGAKLSGPTRLKNGDDIRMCDRHFTFLAKSGTPDSPHHTPTLAE